MNRTQRRKKITIFNRTDVEQGDEAVARKSGKGTGAPGSPSRHEALVVYPADLGKIPRETIESNSSQDPGPLASALQNRSRVATGKKANRCPSSFREGGQDACWMGAIVLYRGAGRSPLLA
jgi:hypothetical protein